MCTRAAVHGKFWRRHETRYKWGNLDVRRRRTMEARNGRQRGRDSNRYVCTIRASIALSHTFIKKKILFLKKLGLVPVLAYRKHRRRGRKRNCWLWLVEIDGIYQLFMAIAIALFARSLLLFKAKSTPQYCVEKERGGKATQAKNKA